MTKGYVIGLDFGTDSVRAVLVDAGNGEELITEVSFYKRWKEGMYCDAAQSRFRQHPLDYIESMNEVMAKLVQQAGKERVAAIKAISADTTGSTPVAINAQGVPLAMTTGFEDDPDAMFILWKDHTADKAAERINQWSRKQSNDYTKYSGGVYSGEWFWAKLLHTLEVNQKVGARLYSWAEHCDWIPALLTGNQQPETWKRSRCAAGHKAMWHESFGGYPPAKSWEQLHSRLAEVSQHLPVETYTADQPAGVLADEWMNKWGLPPGVVIGVGALDAHFGAVGAAIEPYELTKVIGTSTCDMLVVPNEGFSTQCVQGICGQVDGSILPGMQGMEAGQAAFGDLYSWFRDILLFPVQLLNEEDEPEVIRQKLKDRILPELSKIARTLPVTEDDVIALDWINGRRTPFVDLSARAAWKGIGLGTSAAHLFKSLVEATAFGSKVIIDHFKAGGIPVQKIKAIGGIAKRSDFVMQTLSDILNLPIEVPKSEQACALGAAMCAATAAGLYPGLTDAVNAMKSPVSKIYLPDPDRLDVYDILYKKYRALSGVQ